LAREAEMCFASLSMVTDYDCWKEDESAVVVEDILRILRDNADLARRSVAGMASNLPAQRTCGCASALENAIITDREAIGPEARARLGVIIGKYVKGDT
jgi:5'-methylthioadenosine phosphorylase